MRLRKKTDAYCHQGTGRESWQTAMNDIKTQAQKKAPPCPKWLEPEAKKELRRLAKKMEALGVLTEVDMAAFAVIVRHTPDGSRRRRGLRIVVGDPHSIRLSAAGAIHQYRAAVLAPHESVC